MAAQGTTLAQGRAGYAGFSPVSTSSWQPGTTPSYAAATLFPVYSWNLQAPRNRITGDPLGNVAPTNYADGLVVGRLTTSMMVSASPGSVIDPGTGGPGALPLGYTGLLPYFIQRYLIPNSGMDDTVPFQLQLSDANSLYTLPMCKPESFALRIQKGRPIGLDLVWVCPVDPAKLVTSSGTPIRTDARATSLTSGTPGSLAAIYQRTYSQNYKLLMFNNATFALGAAATPGGSFTAYNEFYSMDINYTNNHIVNAPLDGTETIRSYDAGMMRGGADFSIRAYSGQTGDPQPIVDGASIQVVFALASSVTVTLTMPQVVTNTDIDGGATPGASMRLWRTMLEAAFVSPSSGSASGQPQGGGTFYQPVTLVSSTSGTAGVN